MRYSKMFAAFFLPTPVRGIELLFECLKMLFSTVWASDVIPLCIFSLDELD
jgi:hypothetical protein